MPGHFRVTRLAMITGCLFLGLSGCHRTPAETQIRQAIDAAAKAAAATDASAFDALLTDDFSSPSDGPDRRSLVNLLRLASLRHETIHAVVGPIDIAPHGQRFVADFSVTLTSGGRLLPADIGVYRVTSGWRLDGRHWHCYNASWHHAM